MTNRSEVLHREHRGSVYLELRREMSGPFSASEYRLWAVYDRPGKHARPNEISKLVGVFYNAMGEVGFSQRSYVVKIDKTSETWKKFIKKCADFISVDRALNK